MQSSFFFPKWYPPPVFFFFFFIFFFLIYLVLLLSYLYIYILYTLVYIYIYIYLHPWKYALILSPPLSIFPNLCVLLFAHGRESAAYVLIYFPPFLHIFIGFFFFFSLTKLTGMVHSDDAAIYISTLPRSPSLSPPEILYPRPPQNGEYYLTQSRQLHSRGKACKPPC